MKGLFLGQKATVSRTFAPANVEAYRKLTGDQGLQFAAPSAAGTVAEPASGRPAVPGPLLGGLFSQLLGTVLPGPGTNWLKQSLYYPRPARAGEDLMATVEVVRLRPEKQLVNLRTTCVNSGGALVCSGEALVLVRDLLEER